MAIDCLNAFTEMFFKTSPFVFHRLNTLPGEKCFGARNFLIPHRHLFSDQPEHSYTERSQRGVGSGKSIAGVVGGGDCVRKTFDQASARTDRERLALEREPIGCDIWPFGIDKRTNRR